MQRWLIVLALLPLSAFAQFDLVIDGKSMATMTHLNYELGPGEIYIFTEELLFDCQRQSAMELSGIHLFIDDVLVGTLDLLEYFLTEQTIHISTNEQIIDCQQDRIFQSRFD